jgi:pimeloyl-ACP methyl ester carboxylesterase
MPVSFRICHPALGRTEMCAEIDQILTKEFGPEQKFVLVSHSYGTVITTHLLKTPSIAKRVGPVVLIDPVSILLHLPDVAYNFTRRQPQRANEHQLYYFASMDMGVSHTLSRHFFWNENVLWRKDFANRKVTVSLGGRDLIVDTESVGKYLAEPKKSMSNGHAIGHENGNGILIDLDDAENPSSEEHEEDGDEASVIEEEEWKSRSWAGEGIDILWFKNLDHAQVFDKPGTRRMLISAIRSYCEDT